MAAKTPDSPSTDELRLRYGIRHIIALSVVILALNFAANGLLLEYRTGSRIERILTRGDASVVDILAYDAQGNPPSSGTGFFIAPNVLVTASHVVAGAKWAEIRRAGGEYTNITAVLAEDPMADIVLLEVASPSKSHLKLYSGVPQRGEAVFQIGAPQGLSYTASAGIVSAIRKFTNNDEVIHIIQHTAPTFPGNSGCPVFTESGEVVGMDVYVRNNGDSNTISVALNFAISANRITQLLKQREARIPFEQWESKSSSEEGETLSLSQLEDSSIYPNRVENQTKFMEDCAKRHPKSQYAQYSLGRTYFDHQEYDKAISALERATTIDPTFAAAFDLKGGAFLEKEDLSKAKAALTQAVKLEPSLANAWIDLSEIAVREQDNKGAVEACAHARIALDEDGATDPRSFSRLGRTYLSCNDYGDSLNAFLTASRFLRRDDDAETRVAITVGIAESRIGLKQFGPAFKAAWDHLDFLPDNPDLARMAIKAWKAATLEGLTRDDRASLPMIIRQVEGLASRSSKNPWLTMLLGYFYQTAGNNTDAMKAFDAAGQTIGDPGRGEPTPTELFRSSRLEMANVSLLEGIGLRTGKKDKEAREAFIRAQGHFFEAMDKSKGALEEAESTEAEKGRAKALCLAGEHDPAYRQEAKLAYEELERRNSSAANDLLFELNEEIVADVHFLDDGK